jgi:hypothetical protein
LWQPANNNEIFPDTRLQFTGGELTAAPWLLAVKGEQWNGQSKVALCAERHMHPEGCESFSGMAPSTLQHEL